MKKLIALIGIVFIGHVVIAGINDGLLAWYPFNGNANDASGNGNNGIPLNVSYSSGPFGQAVSLNGINGYLELPVNLNSYTTVSASFWMKVNRYPQNEMSHLFSNDNGSWGRNIQMYGPLVWNGQRVGQLRFSNSEDYVGDSGVIQTGQWYHVVGVWTPTNSVLYLNGAISVSGAGSAGGLDDRPSVFLGYPTWGSHTDYADALFDDVLIYSRALSPSEIIDLASPPPSIPILNGSKLVGYIKENWQGDPETNIDFNRFTHIIVAFGIPQTNGTIANSFSQSMVSNLVNLAHAKGVKVLVSVGGGSGNSASLTNIVADADALNVFINQCANLIQDNRLDGLDLDWEVPPSPAQWNSLVRPLARRIHGLGKLLTAAVPGDANLLVDCNYDDVSGIDFLNIMAYDWLGFSGYAPWIDAEGALIYWKSIRGVAQSKLVLGVPFYGSYNNTMNDHIEKATLAKAGGGGIMIWEISDVGRAGSLFWQYLDAIYAILSNTLVCSATDGGVNITGNVGNSSKIIIPDKIGSLQVTGVVDSAFAACTALKEVYFRGNPLSLGGSNVFPNTNLTVYYLPTSTNWGPTYAGCPTAVWKPLIENSVNNDTTTNKAFSFTANWASGQTIIVETCSNLINPVWEPIQTNYLMTDTMTCSDFGLTNHPNHFYRLRSP